MIIRNLSINCLSFKRNTLTIYRMNSSIEMTYTKEMLLNAFQQNKRKRNFMLYKVYESWFSYDLTAETIALQITQDLGFPISKSIVDMTRIRVMKKQINIIMMLI